uniref:Uncharacterized protein n=1 Tax=Sphaerodactylus townsendi TaxID=933632 RepID=A0ACB8EVV6_9SAUR
MYENMCLYACVPFSAGQPYITGNREDEGRSTRILLAVSFFLEEKLRARVDKDHELQGSRDVSQRPPWLDSQPPAPRNSGLSGAALRLRASATARLPERHLDNP